MENKVIEDRENGFTWEFNQWHMYKCLCDDNKKFDTKTLFRDKFEVSFDIEKATLSDVSDRLVIRSSRLDGAKFIPIVHKDYKEDFAWKLKDNFIGTSHDSEYLIKELKRWAKEDSSGQLFVEKFVSKYCGIESIVDKTIYEMMHANRDLAKTLAPNGYFTPDKLDLLNTKHVDPDTSVALWYMQKYPERNELDGEYPFGLHEVTFQDVVDAAKEGFDSNHSEHNQKNYKVSCLVAKLDRALDAEGISNPVFEAIHDKREVNIEDIDIKPIWRNFQNNLNDKLKNHIKNTLIDHGMDKKEANALVDDVYKNPERDAVKENKNTGKDVIQKPVEKKI